MFQGSIVALVTPMTQKGEVDEKKLQELVEMHIENGTNAIVVNGTTGEAPTLSHTEKTQSLKTVLKVAKKRIPIIAGTGTFSTDESVHHTKEAKELGVDACLIVAPYYNRPTQEGLFKHYKTIADAVSVPILLYNVPSRTACDLLPETVKRLSEVSNIVGLKEATGDLTRAKTIKELCGDTFPLYSGEDPSALAFMLQA